MCSVARWESHLLFYNCIFKSSNPINMMNDTSISDYISIEYSKNMCIYTRKYVHVYIFVGDPYASTFIYSLLHVLYINDTVLPIHTIRNDSMAMPQGWFLAFCSHTKWPFYRASFIHPKCETLHVLLNLHRFTHIFY